MSDVPKRHQYEIFMEPKYKCAYKANRRPAGLEEVVIFQSDILVESYPILIS